jgi:hypothetical protein
VERFLNILSDLDAAWWPFLYLRPPKDRPITTVLVAFLAILYGMFAGMLTNAIAALAGAARHLNPLILPLGAMGAFFLVFRLTFAIAWNRRAARLARERSAPSWCRAPDED